MLGFGYMLLVMLIVATISIAENSRTHEGIVPGTTYQRVPLGQDALELIADSWAIIVFQFYSLTIIPIICVPIFPMCKRFFVLPLCKRLFHNLTSLYNSIHEKFIFNNKRTRTVASIFACENLSCLVNLSKNRLIQFDIISSIVWWVEYVSSARSRAR